MCLAMPGRPVFFCVSLRRAGPDAVVSMAAFVLCQRGAVFEAFATTGALTPEDCVCCVRPAVACQPGTRVERTGAALMRAQKRFFAAMEALVDEPVALLPEPPGAAFLRAGERREG